MKTAVFQKMHVAVSSQALYASVQRFLNLPAQIDAVGWVALAESVYKQRTNQWFEVFSKMATMCFCRMQRLQRGL
jgi:hypothetical protein